MNKQVFGVWDDENDEWEIKTQVEQTALLVSLLPVGVCIPSVYYTPQTRACLSTFFFSRQDPIPSYSTQLTTSSPTQQFETQSLNPCITQVSLQILCINLLVYLHLVISYNYKISFYNIHVSFMLLSFLTYEKEC